MGNLKERLASGELTLPTEAEVKAEFCQWAFNDCWNTDCGNAFFFDTAGPRENNFAFCPYCGKRLDVISEPVSDNP